MQALSATERLSLLKVWMIRFKSLLKIMHHQTGKTGFEFDDGMMKATTLFKIVSTQYSGKRRV